MLGSASSAAVTGASSAVLLSRAAEEDALLMTLGVLGSESPCTQHFTSDQKHITRISSAIHDTCGQHHTIFLNARVRVYALTGR